MAQPSDDEEPQEPEDSGTNENETKLQEPEDSGTNENDTPYIRISVQFDISRRCVMQVGAMIISAFIAAPIVDGTNIPLLPL